LAKASCTEKQSAVASPNGIDVQGLAADSIAPKMQWFADAKLGIFIHWGIYAVEGTSESWSFHSRNTTYPYYMSQLKGFGAEKYDPKAWAALIKESGAQYAVITTQHHDGVALWDTKQLTPNTPCVNKDSSLGLIIHSWIGRTMITRVFTTIKVDINWQRIRFDGSDFCNLCMVRLVS